jgi:hypothetical protein
MLSGNFMRAYMKWPPFLSKKEPNVHLALFNIQKVKLTSD